MILKGIHAHASKTWTEQIAIPHNLVVTNLKYCEIIAETYTLKVIYICYSLLSNSIILVIFSFQVEAKPVGFHTNTEVNMQITMGNIPLTIVQDGD